MNEEQAERIAKALEEQTSLLKRIAASFEGIEGLMREDIELLRQSEERQTQAAKPKVPRVGVDFPVVEEHPFVPLIKKEKL